MQRALELGAAHANLPLPADLLVLVVIDEAHERHGLIFRIDVAIIERPPALGVSVVDVLDLRVAAMMHVEHVRMAARGPIQRREFIPGAEHPHVTHVDGHLSLRKTAFRALWILRVAGIEVLRLEAADGFKVFEPHEAAAQVIKLSFGHGHVSDRRWNSSSTRYEGSCPSGRPAGAPAASSCSACLS